MSSYNDKFDYNSKKRLYKKRSNRDRNNKSNKKLKTNKNRNKFDNNKNKPKKELYSTSSRNDGT